MQRQAAVAVARRLAQSPFFWRAQRITFYFANDGELDPGPILTRALAHGKHCYLPRLNRFPLPHMEFVRYRPGGHLRANRFGILEPVDGRVCSPRALDLVLLPLVGFDAGGGRLGMGGGFYDRTFAFIRRLPGPALVGLAHACQEVPCLPREAWDIPLAAIVTDRALLAT